MKAGYLIQTQVLPSVFYFMRKPRLLIGVLLFTVLALAIGAVRHSGSFLVVENVQRADAILVLSGDVNDRRYKRGIELLREAYGQQLWVDASDDVTIYGRTYADWARQFVSENPTVVRDRVRVCPIREDSTVTETKYAAKCLSYLTPGSRVLLVTSDYHTRRALSVFTDRLASYRWYVAPAIDPTQFGPQWWRHREWAKNEVKEWQKLAWWEAVERWR